MKYQSPLVVYIVWHRSFVHGVKVAENLFCLLCRDTNRPLARSIGIPVYFRTTVSPEDICPTQIDFSESNKTAIVVLIDDNLLLDANYVEYIDELAKNCTALNQNCKFYPIAFTQNAFNVSDNIANINFINVVGKDDYFSEIKGIILHELCRLLMDVNSNVDNTIIDAIQPPVKLFISHSKHDDSLKDVLAP